MARKKVGKIGWLRVFAVLVIAGAVLSTQQIFKNDTPKVAEGALDVRQKNIEIASTRTDLLLPDLKILPPNNLYIEIRNGVKKLRFDTTFANVGDAPLELIGVTDEEKQKTIATQVIFKKDGSKEEMKIGEFVYHIGHTHWHVDNYAQFELMRYDENEEPTEVVAQTDKFSFCIWDEHTYDLSLSGAPKTRQYARCPKNIQGSSVGWGDTYKANLEGQEVDITNVPDGNYIVRSTVNAESTILEKDYSNNFSDLFVQITGNRVRITE